MNYTFKNQLGQGGMATVFLAEDKRFQTDVAIKVLNKEFVHNDNIRKRFLAEARNLFKMSHPNIVKVTDLIEEEGTVAFVMEYIKGQTLKDYLADNGKLTEKEIINLFSQMLDAVMYVHEQNLVHRDIKPSNFMLSNIWVIKLMDFGIAKNLDSNSAEHTITTTTQTMGTPMYMSPEQIKSTKNVTSQSDIYSLGVVLWQMVTGEKPYNIATTSTFEMQTKIVNEALPLTGTKWDKLIQQCTEKETSARFKSIAEIKKNLAIIDSKESIKESKAETTILEDSINNEKPKTESTVIEEKVQNGKTLDENSLDLIYKSLATLSFAKEIKIEDIINALKEKKEIKDQGSESFYNDFFNKNNKGLVLIILCLIASLIFLAWLWVLPKYNDGFWYFHWVLKLIYSFVFIRIIILIGEFVFAIFSDNDHKKADRVIEIIKKYYIK